MTVATTEDGAIEIPTRLWRVQYTVRTVDSRQGEETHDEQHQVIWFETEQGFQDFVAKAWMSQQDNDFYRDEIIVEHVHRVLVESSTEVALDVGVRVQFQ